jgi:hypothetical protein
VHRQQAHIQGVVCMTKGARCSVLLGTTLLLCCWLMMQPAALLRLPSDAVLCDSVLLQALPWCLVAAGRQHLCTSWLSCWVVWLAVSSHGLCTAQDCSSAGDNSEHMSYHAYARDVALFDARNSWHGHCTAQDCSLAGEDMQHTPLLQTSYHHIYLTI